MSSPYLLLGIFFFVYGLRSNSCCTTNVLPPLVEKKVFHVLFGLLFMHCNKSHVSLCCCTIKIIRINISILMLCHASANSGDARRTRAGRPRSCTNTFTPRTTPETQRQPTHLCLRQVCGHESRSCTAEDAVGHTRVRRDSDGGNRAMPPGDARLPRVDGVKAEPYFVKDTSQCIRLHCILRR